SFWKQGFDSPTGYRNYSGLFSIRFFYALEPDFFSCGEQGNAVKSIEFPQMFYLLFTNINLYFSFKLTLIKIMYSVIQQIHVCLDWQHRYNLGQMLIHKDCQMLPALVLFHRIEHFYQKDRLLGRL